MGLKMNVDDQRMSDLYPVWANVRGTDEFGAYADLQIDEVTQRFRWVPPGTFQMGSPETEPMRFDHEIQHPVTLTRGFWLADTVCTQALWEIFLGICISTADLDRDHPMVGVNWNSVQAFLKGLNEAVPNLSARLPSESQWEYACRAGTTTPFSFGENITPEQVNYDGNYPYVGSKKGLYRRRTVPVKSLPPNPWGLFEMHGNVWEWCTDWFGAYPSQHVIDPSGPAMGTKRMLRGGSWFNIGRNVRSASRFVFVPAFRLDFIGLRLALGDVV